jgi:NAD binding domain of 6-phosphogluconate dehydrogenase
MFKAESGSLRFSSATATEAASGQQSADRTNGRGTAPGDIGFVGLGRMGTAMAKNLAAAGRRVIGCVRRPEQMGMLLALGLKPTTNLADLFDCEVVISMLPDDEAVREVACGRQGRKGLAAGLRPGAIHLSMSTKAAALKLGFVTEAEFDRVVDPKKMVKPYVAAAPANADAA